MLFASLVVVYAEDADRSVEGGGGHRGAECYGVCVRPGEEGGEDGEDAGLESEVRLYGGREGEGGKGAVDEEEREEGGRDTHWTINEWYNYI